MQAHPVHELGRRLGGASLIPIPSSMCSLLHTCHFCDLSLLHPVPRVDENDRDQRLAKVPHGVVPGLFLDQFCRRHRSVSNYSLALPCSGGALACSSAATSRHNGCPVWSPFPSRMHVRPLPADTSSSPIVSSSSPPRCATSSFQRRVAPRWASARCSWPSSWPVSTVLPISPPLISSGRHRHRHSEDAVSGMRRRVWHAAASAACGKSGGGGYKRARESSHMEARPTLARPGTHSGVGWRRRGWRHSNRQASMRGQRSCWPPRQERGAIVRASFSLFACGVTSDAARTQTTKSDYGNLRLRCASAEIRASCRVRSRHTSAHCAD